MARFLEQVTRLAPEVCGPAYEGAITKSEAGVGRIDFMATQSGDTVTVFAVNLKREAETVTFTFDAAPEQVTAARKVLADLQWAPFKSSSDAQIYPIRQMQLNKELTKVIADERLEQSEKDQKIADLKRQIDEIESLAEMLPRL